MVTVGENVKRIRKKRGLTQKELAKLCNVHELTIRRCEKNKVSTDQLTLSKIAKALGIQLDALYENPDFLHDSLGNIFNEKKCNF